MAMNNPPKNMDFPLIFERAGFWPGLDPIKTRETSPLSSWQPKNWRIGGLDRRRKTEGP
jgi:hypothetical protein